MRVTKLTLAVLVAAGAVFTSCSSDDDNNIAANTASLIAETTEINTEGLTIPDSYEFIRDFESSVSFSGQTTRLQQVSAIGDALKDETTTIATLTNNFRNGTGFTDSSLETGKKIRNKTANSLGLFENGIGNNSDAIKTVYDNYLASQVSEVFPNWETTASAGVAGVADGNRYVNAKGLEYNQAFLKSLIGGLVADQAINHYTNRLDDDNFDGTNSFRDENDAGTLADDDNHTTMEHHWDEAYGYVYGVAADDDDLLQKYINRVENDADFAGIAARISNAFTIGRAAIVAKNYDVRDEAVQVIRTEISRVIAIRAVYYLQQGKNSIVNGRETAFHALSEGYGFVYSLQFTSLDGQNAIFSQDEVDGFIADLEAGNGFWDITEAKLDEISNAIAAKFNFTVAQAAE